MLKHSPLSTKNNQFISNDEFVLLMQTQQPKYIFISEYSVTKPSYTIRQYFNSNEVKNTILYSLGDQEKVFNKNLVDFYSELKHQSKPNSIFFNLSDNRYIKVDLEEIIKLKNRLDEINSIPFDEIIWYIDGVNVSDKLANADDWKSNGSNNSDFVDSIHLKHNLFLNECDYHFLTEVISCPGGKYPMANY